MANLQSNKVNEVDSPYLSENSEDSWSDESLSDSEEGIFTVSFCNDDLEPVATAAEQAEYQRVIEEEEEEQMLRDRFEGNVELQSWYASL